MEIKENETWARPGVKILTLLNRASHVSAQTWNELMWTDCAPSGEAEY